MAKESSRTTAGSTTQGVVTRIVNLNGAGVNSYQVKHGGRTVFVTSSSANATTVANALVSTAVVTGARDARETGRLNFGNTLRGTVLVINFGGQYVVHQGGREVLRTTSQTDASAVATAIQAAG